MLCYIIICNIFIMEKIKHVLIKQWSDFIENWEPFYAILDAIIPVREKVYYEILNILTNKLYISQNTLITINSEKWKITVAINKILFEN